MNRLPLAHHRLILRVRRATDSTDIVDLYFAQYRTIVNRFGLKVNDF